MKRIFFVLIVFILFASTVQAEDLKTIFNNVNKYVQDNNYSKALKELDWARKEIEKMHLTKLQEFLPDELVGFKGEKFNSNIALGITNVERIYSSAEGKVKVSITGTGKGSGPLGGIAAFGQMAAMMQTQNEGQDTFRIKGLTASLDTKKRNPKLSIFLDSGSIVALEMQNGKDAEALKKMAEALEVGDLDNYLKGAS